MNTGCITDPFGYLVVGVVVGQASVAIAWAIWARFRKPVTDDLREEVETMRALVHQGSRYFDAIVWALGMAHEGFAERQEDQGAYWWRSELRRRAFPHGLPFASQHWKDREAGVPEPDWVRD